jgi:hypothetical protein
MVLLSKFFDWPEALVVVKPETCLKWHRTRSVLSGAGSPAGAADRG